METPVSAVIIDVPSVQQFVFGNNKMRLNVGASYLIKELYKKNLKDIGININAWCSQDYPDIPCILYEGGGNVVLLIPAIRNSEGAWVSQVNQFITDFSRQILIEYPGFVVMFGTLDNVDLSETHFSTSMGMLHKNLTENKSRNKVQTAIPMQSLTAMCEYNFLPAAMSIELGQDVGKEISYLAPLTSVQWITEVELRKRDKENYSCLDLPAPGGRPYFFTNELEKLGQRDTNSFISVIHLDGNGMGELFKRCNTREDLQSLSRQVETTYKNAIKDVFNAFVIEKMPQILNDKDRFGIREACSKPEIGRTCVKDAWYLPFRPLMVAGDDVNIVAEGRIGLYLAEQILMTLEAEKFDTPTGKVQVQACAGIAIVGTHFPFYQAYQIAEELCKRAKKESRKQPGSYIDFAVISSAGLMKDFDKFLDDNYTINGVKARGGPYHISTNSWEILKDQAKSTKKWSSGKRHELREVIGGEVAERKLFELQLKHIEHVDLPKDAKFEEYYDAFEFLDFYLDA